MSYRKPALFALLCLLLVAGTVGGVFGYCEINDHLRVKDAEAAYLPVESVGCYVLSQPLCSRYCHYILTFPPESKLSDTNIEILKSLNRLPEQNSFDVVIETSAVTDASLTQLSMLDVIDYLEVRKTSITDAGIERLQQRLPKTVVLKRQRTADRGVAAEGKR